MLSPRLTPSLLRTASSYLSSHLLPDCHLLKGKTHVVTTSYINPAIRELNAAVREAEAVVIDEIDLDPAFYLSILLI